MSTATEGTTNMTDKLRGTMSSPVWEERLNAISGMVKADKKQHLAPWQRRHNSRAEQGSVWYIDVDEFLAQFVANLEERAAAEVARDEAIVEGLRRGLSNRDVATVFGCSRENIAIKYGPSRRAQGPGKPYTQAQKEEAIDNIACLADDVVDWEQWLRTAAGAALATGQVSYRILAEAMGVTRQMAEKRFKGMRTDQAHHAQERGDAVENFRMIGAKRAAIKYEVRDEKGHVVSSHTKPSVAFGKVSKGQVVVKVYPEGEERIVK